MKVKGTRLGSWECNYCGHEHNWGHEYDCRNCERPRDKEVRFYLKEDAPYATPEQKALMGTGPNWYCEHCQSGNKNSNKECWNCGAPEGSSPEHTVRHYAPKDVPGSAREAAELKRERDEDRRKEEARKHSARYSVAPPSVKPQSRQERRQSTRFDTRSETTRRTSSRPKIDWKKRLIQGGIGLAVLTAVIGIIWFVSLFFNTHEETALVKGFDWSQNVAIEEYQTIIEEDWNIPAGGRELDSVWKDTGRDKEILEGYETVYYTDTCSDTEYVPKTCTGTRDDGNGGFTEYEYDCGSDVTTTYSCEKSREEPVYRYEDIFDWFYTYEIDKWINIGNYPTSGTNQEPYFDSYDPTEPNVRRIEQQGKYTVHFYSYNEDIGHFSESYPLNEWLLFDLDQEVTLVVNYFNIVMEIQR